MAAVTTDALVRAVNQTTQAAPDNARFGGHKVFVSALWGLLGAAHPDLCVGSDLAAFKRWLVAANREGRVRLARADLVGAMDPELVRASEVADHLSRWHFVIDETRW